jgi:DNA-binding FadR family transcriptional regulator
MMAAEGYTSGACEADIKFHETLMKCAHNEKLLQLYITSHIPLFHEKMGKAMGTIDDHEQTDKEHRQIVKALKTKNLKLAEQTLTAHFARVYLLYWISAEKSCANPCKVITINRS